MATLIRKEPKTVTSVHFDEISWVILRLMMQEAPDATVDNILLYITQCVDEQNIHLKDYYATFRERKRKYKEANQE